MHHRRSIRNQNAPRRRTTWRSPNFLDRRHGELPYEALPRESTALLGVAAVGARARASLALRAGQTAKSVVVSTVKNSKLGTLLVSGKTLYTLKASKTACSTSCLKVWPELVLPKGVKKATAGSGVSASKLGTISRARWRSPGHLRRQAALLLRRRQDLRSGQWRT